MLEYVVVRIAAFLLGIFVLINSLAKLIFPAKIKEFVSEAPTFKFYVVSGLINLLAASLLIYLATQGKLVDVASYAVTLFGVAIAGVGVAEMIFASKFKEWFIGGKNVRVSVCMGLLMSLLLIYMAL